MPKDKVKLPKDKVELPKDTVNVQNKSKSSPRKMLPARTVFSCHLSHGSSCKFHDNSHPAMHLSRKLLTAQKCNNLVHKAKSIRNFVDCPMQTECHGSDGNMLKANELYQANCQLCFGPEDITQEVDSKILKERICMLEQVQAKNVKTVKVHKKSGTTLTRDQLDNKAEYEKQIKSIDFMKRSQQEQCINNDKLRSVEQKDHGHFCYGNNVSCNMEKYFQSLKTAINFTECGRGKVCSGPMFASDFDNKCPCSLPNICHGHEKDPFLSLRNILPAHLATKDIVRSNQTGNTLSKTHITEDPYFLDETVSNCVAAPMDAKLVSETTHCTSDKIDAAPADCIFKSARRQLFGILPHGITSHQDLMESATVSQEAVLQTSVFNQSPVKSHKFSLDKFIDIYSFLPEAKPFPVVQITDTSMGFHDEEVERYKIPIRNYPINKAELSLAPSSPIIFDGFSPTTTPHTTSSSEDIGYSQDRNNGNNTRTAHQEYGKVKTSVKLPFPLHRNVFTDMPEYSSAKAQTLNSESLLLTQSFMESRKNTKFPTRIKHKRETIWSTDLEMLPTRRKIIQPTDFPVTRGFMDSRRTQELFSTSKTPIRGKNSSNKLSTHDNSAPTTNGKDSLLSEDCLHGQIKYNNSFVQTPSSIKNELANTALTLSPIEAAITEFNADNDKFIESASKANDPPKKSPDAFGPNYNFHFENVTKLPKFLQTSTNVKGQGPILNKFDEVSETYTNPAITPRHFASKTHLLKTIDCETEIKAPFNNITEGSSPISDHNYEKLCLDKPDVHWVKKSRNSFSPKISFLKSNNEPVSYVSESEEINSISKLYSSDELADNSITTPMRTMDLSRYKSLIPNRVKQLQLSVGKSALNRNEKQSKKSLERCSSIDSFTDCSISSIDVMSSISRKRKRGYFPRLKFIESLESSFYSERSSKSPIRYRVSDSESSDCETEKKNPFIKGFHYPHMGIDRRNMYRNNVLNVPSNTEVIQKSDSNLNNNLSVNCRQGSTHTHSDHQGVASSSFVASCHKAPRHDVLAGQFPSSSSDSYCNKRTKKRKKAVGKRTRKKCFENFLL